MSLPVYQLAAIIDKLAAQTLIKRNAGGFIVTYVNSSCICTFTTMSWRRTLVETIVLLA
jgi:hypothetical protein